MSRALLVMVSFVVACGGGADPDRSVEQPGRYGAGTRRVVATDTARGRTLTMQAWYPTEAATTNVAIETLEDEPHRTQYADLLATAPACPSRMLDVAVDAAPAAGSFPGVVISHCHECTRLSNASTAIRLATHGFVVISVDHADDTLWDHLAGSDASLDSAFLEVRTADVRFALDQLLASDLPVDAAHLGVLGHSFGAVTAGRVAQVDARIGAAAALCAPMENPLIQGVTLAELTQPLMFIVAVEDNSITEFGNIFIRNNFRDAPHEAWKLEVADAGHWSVSDLDGLVDIFQPGCGEATRQTDGAPFTYLDPEVGRATAASYATAFFKATLGGDAGARAYLDQAEHHD